MTSLFVLTLSGFFLNLNISCSFLLVSLSKVSSLTLCIYYTTLVVGSPWFLIIFFQKNTPCPEVVDLEGTPSKSVDLIRFIFPFS
ncbi:Putative phage protein [Streptococcus pneumoniae SPN034156]|nr:Putative phage protein [Streptococcus pneumoniae SPN034156]